MYLCLWSLGQKVLVLNAYDIVNRKSLSSFGLPAKVKTITAAFYDEYTGRALFFTGKKYYRYILEYCYIFKKKEDRMQVIY